MRLTTACVLLLLACAACATSGKVLPTVDNNVVSYRSFRDVTIASNYEFYKSDDKSSYVSSSDLLSITTDEDVVMTTFRYKNLDALPAAIMLVFSTLPDRWYYTQQKEDFYLTLGGHQYRAILAQKEIDEAPYYLIYTYYYPDENKNQMVIYIFPKKNIPEEAKDEEARKNYVIAKMQEAIVEF